MSRSASGMNYRVCLSSDSAHLLHCAHAVWIDKFDFQMDCIVDVQLAPIAFLRLAKECAEVRGVTAALQLAQERRACLQEHL